MVNPESHGFYRFFAFEGIVLLVMINHPHWFGSPWSPLQIVSWSLLLLSIYFVLHSLKTLKEKGGYEHREGMVENFAFENTVNLVEDGPYRYVRHPMYSSLLFLAWGAFFKHISSFTLILVFLVSFFLFLAARVEERENVIFFGEKYVSYMARSRMFVPWII